MTALDEQVGVHVSELKAEDQSLLKELVCSSDWALVGVLTWQCEIHIGWLLRRKVWMNSFEECPEDWRQKLTLKGFAYILSYPLGVPLCDLPHCLFSFYSSQCLLFVFLPPLVLRFGVF